MSNENDESKASPTRRVSERLEGWARRVGSMVADATGRPTIAEAARAPLERARTKRLHGDVEGALADLRELVAARPSDPIVRFSLALTLIHDILTGGRPIRALEEARQELGETLGRGPAQLITAAIELHGATDLRSNERVLDALRRAGDLSRLPTAFEAEARFLLHLLAAQAHRSRGDEERALRELRKARVRTPEGAGESLRTFLLDHGVELCLAAGEVADAEGWIREALSQAPERPVYLEMLCRVMAAKGDRIAAHALLDSVVDQPNADRTLVFVGLTVGLPKGYDPLAECAMRALQHDAQDPRRRRDWALTQLDAMRAREEGVLDEAIATPLLEALVDASVRAPLATRDRFLQELCHTMLRLDQFPQDGLDLVRARLDRDRGTVAEELRLVHTRVELLRGKTPTEDFVAGSMDDAALARGHTPRFRADPGLGGPCGPDPKSPVRNTDLRTAVLQSQRALVAAEVLIARDALDLAQDLLVEALVHWPEQTRARSLLANVVAPPSGRRLEDLLSTATEKLATVPNRVLGVSLAGVQAAMARVIAARERLARPLTIAIMGEFSAGKSTFVNALLGEAVAPMGVLPTTTTINMFRRGAGGGGRVHYRDGRISLIARADVHAFLHGLDDDEASRIRHVEIERHGDRMGDAAVVDTPGLNALDEYHERVAREFLDEADAVVWVFSATRSGAASEATMLRELRESGRQVLGILNKTDTLDEAERRELTDYLREQLGDVLVEVIPLEGREALQWRTAEAPRGPDPFQEVDTALETHFLARARELKRALTAKRLIEALHLARDACMEAIETLESRDAGPEHPGVESSDAALLLQRLGDRLESELIKLDDVLVRESLALGVITAGKGLAKGPIDDLDAEYLGSCFRDAALRGLRRALVEVALEDAAASEVLDHSLAAWAKGHLDGLIAANFIASLVRSCGPAAASGESAAREAFRSALAPIARTWSAQVRSMTHEVQRAQHRAARWTSNAPRAEAMRLRSGVIASIDALTHATEELQT